MSNTTAAQSASDISETENLRLQALRNVIYHNARRYALEGASRWINFFVILAGTATAASLGNVLCVDERVVSLVTGAITTVLGACSLIFDFAVRAKNHEILAKEYFRLLGEIDGAINPGPQEEAGWKKSFAEIAANEPPTYRALDALAMNEAAQAIFGDEMRMLKVSKTQRLFKHILSYGGTTFPYDEPKRT